MTLLGRAFDASVEAASIHRSGATEIEAEGPLSKKLLVPDDYLGLILHLMAPQFQFQRQAPLVDRLQQSRPLFLWTSIAAAMTS
jgi:hypothetical protein